MGNVTQLRSPQQNAAVAAVLNPRSGNLMVQAVAGSGKTFTLFEMVKELDGFVGFAAYSKPISVELEEKADLLKDQIHCRLTIGTCHRFGLRAWMRVQPNVKIMKKTEKCDLLMAEVYNERLGRRGVPAHLQAFVRKAYIMARQWGVGVNPEFQYGDREAWLKLIDRFDLDMEIVQDEDEPYADFDALIREAVNWTVYVLKLGVEKAVRPSPVPGTKTPVSWIDFEDMLYMPVFKKIKVFQYKTVLVDECQDLNWTRIAFSSMMIAPGGRAVFVGDPHQAIFGFTGADSQSMENIRTRFNCSVLPLSVSFRSAKSIIRFVQQWVSHIEAHPDAPEGISPLMPEGVIKAEEIWSKNLHVTEDAILCRNNAPLVELFFQCLIKGIPAHIEGKKDIAQDLIKTLNRFPKVKNLVALREKLQNFKEKEIKKLEEKGKDEKAGKIADIVDALIALIDAMPPTATAYEVKAKIETMFSDTPEGEKPKTLTLTTIHKSKGREWKRVFWWGRNRYNPSSYARQDWQMEQEINLMYVAGTRAKLELYDVIVPIPPKPKNGGRR